jgi:MYXO-CTERM domain-containing protein
MLFMDVGAVDAGRDAGTRDAALDVGGADVELLLDDPSANCACSAPGSTTQGGRSWGLLALAAGLVTRRRKRVAQP